jgi:uncharacterized iron-regulated protein
MSKAVDISKMGVDYEKLKKELAGVGLIAQGTIIPRHITKPDPSDRRKKKSYGPYYQWTMKIKARTVTINLSPSQMREFKKAISNNRKLENTLTRMRELSLQILNESTVGVPKRVKRGSLNRS